MENIFRVPGFRFYPTDIDLIKHLRKKVNGKCFPYNAIAEIKLYQFAPWELEEKSCLQSRDRVWFFFCSPDRKYGSGKRTNRAAKYGYWKTTGKDKSISYDSKTVGKRKTLIFYEGKPPKGARTDWVMHEYRIEDDRLINAGFSKDSYVVCKVFQKSGRGPKNGEQHGAPSYEDDWSDDDGEANDASIIVPLTEPSSAKLRPEASENMAMDMTESGDGQNSVIWQLTQGQVTSENWQLTQGQVTSENWQLTQGQETSENLAMNSRTESVFVIEHNYVQEQLAQQYDVPLVSEVHNPNIGNEDDPNFFEPEQLLSQICGDGGSCSEEKLDAPIPQENGNKDATCDGHDIYDDLMEFNSNEESNAYSFSGLPFIYDPFEYVDGSFLEEADLLPMQDDFFNNGTTGALHVHSSKLNMPASQEIDKSKSNWEPQDAAKCLPSVPMQYAEETVTRNIPSPSARGEQRDVPPPLDCIPSASATAAGYPHSSLEGYLKNVRSCGSILHIQAEVIMFRSSYLYYSEKLGTVQSFQACTNGRFMLLRLLAFFLVVYLAVIIFASLVRVFFINKPSFITSILYGLYLPSPFQSKAPVYHPLLLSARKMVHLLHFLAPRFRVIWLGPAN